MTEKRFTIDEDKIKDNQSPYCYIEYYKGLVPIVDLLNELAEENQDNKAMIEFLSTENTQIMNELKTRTQIQHQLEEENEQLKQENKELRQENEELNQKYDKFAKFIRRNHAVGMIHRILKGDDVE